MKIGILRETRQPQDNRVPLTPSQCEILIEENPDVQAVVQPSDFRCYSDDEYRYHGITVAENLTDCDVLLGVKEIPPHLLIADKTYFIFSHTIKKQPHNRALLQEVLRKNIRLIDWETLTDEKHRRLIAFGRWAGIVGAYHALRMIGLGTKRFHVKQMSECHNFAEAQKELPLMKFPAMKIVLTGTGRVSHGADFMLQLAGVKKVKPADFLEKEFDQMVYTQLGSRDMYHCDDLLEFNTDHFHNHAEKYRSTFAPFAKVAAVLINGIYWDKRMAPLFTKEQMKEKDFAIEQIADITCDIGPEASVPSTLRTSSIADPYYGYDAQTEKLTEPFLPNVIDIMAIDNLPNELPRDASEDFGNMFMSRILPELKKPDSKIIYRATIALNGKLNEPYGYLSDYAGSP